MNYDLNAATGANLSDAELHELAQKLGFARAFGINTLYKFKGFAAEQRDHVFDMLENTRVYFSRPDQFNDPYDVAPVLRLGGDPNDPKFFAELQAHEREALLEQGMSEAEIEVYRKTHGVTIDLLADGAQADLRRQLLAGTRILCLTAECNHPLQWSHYADQHRGVCLHFSCAHGSALGQARAVKYRQERVPILIPLDRQSEDDVTDRMVLTKAEFWAYEKEYRVLAQDGVDSGVPLEHGVLQLDRSIMTGITLGMRMAPDDEALLLAKIDQVRPGLPVWKAHEDFDRFWMKTQRIR